MGPKLYLAVAAVLAGIFYKWLQQTEFPLTDHLEKEGLFEAPEWLPRVMRELPERKLTPEERETLRQDGVVLLRGVMADPVILGLLNTSWGLSNTVRLSDFRYNRVFRSLVRDGPLGAVGASALNVSVARVFTTNVFPVKAGGKNELLGPPVGGVHIDVDSSVGYILPMVSVWVALEDSERPVEFLKGSHRANLKRDCEYGSDLTIHDACIQQLIQDAGGEEGGARIGWDVKAGDVIVFYAQTFHWTLQQEQRRTSISLRIVAEDLKLDFVDFHYLILPWTVFVNYCDPIRKSPYFPIIYPRQNSTVDDMPFPLFKKNFDDIGLALYKKPNQRGCGESLCPGARSPAAAWQG